MQDIDPKEFAKMLQKPEGEFGIRVAERMNESNASMIQWAIEKIALRDHDKVLEIGFGNGFHIYDLLESESSIRYTGLDFSNTMVEIVKKKYSSQIKSGRASFHLGTSTALPFATEAFDKIFTVNTLYFWDDPSVHLQQIYAALKPEGLFCIAFKSRSFMQHLPVVPYGFTLYNQEEVVTLLKANGFVIKDVDYRKEPEQEIAGMRLIPDAILITATKKNNETRL